MKSFSFKSLGLVGWIPVIVMFGVVAKSLFFAYAKQHQSRQFLELKKESLVVLNTEITEVYMAAIKKRLMQLDAELPADQPIYLWIDSPGGDIIAGLDLISVMHSMRRPVHTVTKRAASMAFYIVQNANTRFMTE